MLGDRRVTVEQIAQARTCLLFHVELGMFRLSARWVARLLNADHDAEKARFFNLFNINPVFFLCN